MQKFDEALITKIVKQVVCELNKEGGLDKTVEPKSGILSVRGNSVKCEKFDTGKEGDRVYLKDVLEISENKNLAAGFMEMDRTEFEWTLNYDEVDYIIEGQLDIKINGEIISGKAGDVIMIPAGSTIHFSVPDYAKFFYVTYPANWAEQQ